MNYIIIYLEIEHLLNFLTQEEKGHFLDLLISYGKNQELPNITDPKLANVFNFMKNRLDLQIEKAKKKAKIARENGKKGGRTKKSNQNPTKPKKTQQEPSGTQSAYKELSDSLKEIIQYKQNRKIANKNWHNEIRKLIEIDLINRTNALQDVKTAIQAIEDYSGEQYFPIVQSASALREKFSKIENYLARQKGLRSDLSASEIMDLDLTKEF